MKKYLFDLLFLAIFALSTYCQDREEFIFESCGNKINFSNSTEFKKMFNDSIIEVWAYSTTTKLPSGDVKANSSVIFNLNNLSIKFKKRNDGIITNVNLVKIEGLNNAEVVKIAWTFGGGYGTAGFGGNGEDYFLVASNSLEPICSFQTSYSDEEMTSHGLIKLYFNNDSIFGFYSNIRTGPPVGGQKNTDGSYPDYSEYIVFVHKNGETFFDNDLQQTVNIKSYRNGMIHYIMLNDSNINVRESPSYSGKKIGMLVGTEKLSLIDILPKPDTVAGNKGFWIQIETPDKIKGWIWSAFIEKWKRE